MRKAVLVKGFRGFTLIELLVVLGILGILAAALIATIDPFEQLKKSQDANTKNIAVEFENAVIRYYTTHTGLPWWTNANNGANCTTVVNNSPDATTLDQMITTGTGCISVLIDEGELKRGFRESKSLKDIYVTNQGATSPPGTPTTVCFMPTSKSQQRDPNTQYCDNKGTDTTSCTCISKSPSSPTATKCYWCTQ